MDTTVDQILAGKGTAIFRIGPKASVTEAVALMNEQKIGSLLVMDESTLLGIFTERDVLTRVVGRGIDPATTMVGEVMTRSIVSVRLSTTLHEALKIVDSHRCRHLPVVEDGKLLGLVSIGDLTRATIRTLERDVVELSRYIGAPVAV